jgi:hypothetical protein
MFLYSKTLSGGDGDCGRVSKKLVGLNLGLVLNRVGSVGISGSAHGKFDAATSSIRCGRIEKQPSPRTLDGEFGDR